MILVISFLYFQLISPMRLILFSIIFCVTHLTALAQKLHRDQISLSSDNDAYLATGQDRYYTNGLEIKFSHALTRTIKKGDTLNRVLDISIGQNIYNAHTGSIDHLWEVDRPVTAFLYQGAGISWINRKERALRLGYQIGFIGPRAGGKEAQKLIHSLVGFYEIEGWEFQLKNSVEFNAMLNHKTLITRGADYDLLSDLNLRLGTTFSNVEIAAVLRAGRINKLFQSVSTNTRIGDGNETIKEELFFFFRPSLKYIIYDATIQGGLFNEDKGPVTFKPKRLIFFPSLGVHYASRRWDLSYAIQFTGREIKRQQYAHQYGNISLGFRF